MEDWNDLITQLPGAHILQTEEWGEIKRMNGWTPVQKIWRDLQGNPVAASMILQRPIPIGGLSARMRLLYIPRGPLLDWADVSLRQRVLSDLERYSHEQGGIFIKMDPEVILGKGVPGTEGCVEDESGATVIKELTQRGWRFSPEQIQFRNTVWLDLSPEEGVWLERMKQKTRYNIRLAQRKGVTVRIGNEGDLEMLYKMYLETSVRDGFVIRTQSYYLELWRTFLRVGKASALIAEVEGQPVGGVILFHFAGRAWYMFGMSNLKHKDKMPNYLLQWEAMRLAKSLGCLRYDLWGAPDHFQENDPLWNVFRFKEGLGGEVIRTMGAWDYSPRPWLYKLYTQTLPHLLNLMRRTGKARARRALESS